MRLQKSFLALLALALTIPLAACGDDRIVIVPEAEALWTFDTGLGPWVPLDLGLAAGSSFNVAGEAGAARFEIDVPSAGGEGLLTQEFVLTPGVEYLVLIQFLFETSDSPETTVPWGLVVGTSVEDGPWTFNTDLDTGATGIIPVTTTIRGDLSVTGGPPSDANDRASEIRVGIGVRPTTDGQRSYGVDEILVQFIPADQIG